MEQFKAWWESISPREQQLAVASAVVIGIAVLYWGIWTPLSNQLSEAQKQLTRAETRLAWTQEKATLLLKSGAGKATKRRGNLTQILNSSARQNQITFSRIVNKKDKIEVWINEVEFDAFLAWLTKLSNQHGVAVLNADLAKTDRTGYVKVNRLLLGY
ncbi:type II secretion system protein M [Psychromonas sp. psych-6C06]|uniref:type II secretion system protein M n=1 Tax=Psychromonas sp. psych-6C06 TaxID=2058089 RepID=UPI000C3279E7|nr:type II secretion system protein M [Psychromonas sp. psych-6C06]PKF61456.1 type II secretion system protein M [Psychromonas sp. psych-6C06]